jgi:hypothetical protein
MPAGAQHDRDPIQRQSNLELIEENKIPGYGIVRCGNVTLSSAASSKRTQQVMHGCRFRLGLIRMSVIKSPANMGEDSAARSLNTSMENSE